MNSNNAYSLSVKNIRSVLTAGLLLLIALFMISQWFFNHRLINSISSSNNNSVDYIMANVDATEFNELGKIKNQLRAKTWTHMNNREEISNLVEPEFIFHEKDTAPWTMTSNQAQIFHQKGRIELHQNVYLQQPSSSNNVSTQAKTSKMIVFPQKHYAESSEEVTFIQPGLTVTSIGFRTNLKTGAIELLSDAKGHYANQHS